MSSEPLVSVIIPAYNCENIISKTIHAVLDQSYRNIELIVIDDGSVDRTSETIQVFPNVVFAQQTNAGPASARNHGARLAKGGFLFFTDSDCIPLKNWIETAMKPFSDSEVAVVAGSYDIANPESLLARGIHAEILYRHHHLMPMYPKSFGSYNFGIRKEVFERVGGFDESYRFASGEDNDLSYKVLKAGYKIFFEKKSLVAHVHTTRVWKYLNEQKRHGFWRVKMYADHPEMVRGDGYTFWKDMIEVPLSFLIFVLLILSCVINAVAFFLLLAGMLLVIECFFAFRYLKNIFDSFFYSFVMWLRSFFRMFGFSSGIMYYLYKILYKKNK